MSRLKDLAILGTAAPLAFLPSDSIAQETPDQCPKCPPVPATAPDVSNPVSVAELYVLDGSKETHIGTLRIPRQGAWAYRMDFVNPDGSTERRATNPAIPTRTDDKGQHVAIPIPYFPGARLQMRFPHADSLRQEVHVQPGVEELVESVIPELQAVANPGTHDGTRTLDITWPVDSLAEALSRNSAISGHDLVAQTGTVVLPGVALRYNTTAGDNDNRADGGAYMWLTLSPLNVADLTRREFELTPVNINNNVYFFVKTLDTDEIPAGMTVAEQKTDLDVTYRGAGIFGGITRGSIEQSPGTGAFQNHFEMDLEGWTTGAVFETDAVKDYNRLRAHARALLFDEKNTTAHISSQGITAEGMIGYQRLIPFTRTVIDEKLRNAVKKKGGWGLTIGGDISGSAGTYGTEEHGSTNSSLEIRGGPGFFVGWEHGILNPEALIGYGARTQSPRNTDAPNAGDLKEQGAVNGLLYGGRVSLINGFNNTNALRINGGFEQLQNAQRFSAGFGVELGRFGLSAEYQRFRDKSRDDIVTRNRLLAGGNVTF